jgi:hypothetical protein
MATDPTVLRKGTTGRAVFHAHEPQYAARVRLVRDSPLDQKWLTVRLLEDAYCLERGDITRVRRDLFTPAEVTHGD